MLDTCILCYTRSNFISGGGTTHPTRFTHEVPQLTERFSQDPIESYFGDQRSRGHRNTNPNVQQFNQATNILRISSGLSKKREAKQEKEKENESQLSSPQLQN